MKTAKWTFNVSSHFEFAAFYVSLIDFWLSHSNRSSARTAVDNIARESRAGRQLLEKCLPYLKREIFEGSTANSASDRKLLAVLYNEIERVARTRMRAKAFVSLPERGCFRKTTKSPLRKIGAPSSYDRRHVIADFFSKHFVQDLLNQLPDGETQCDYLHEVGCDPDRFNGSIQLAARKWQLNIFNHLDNLFMGPGRENRVLGARGIVLDPAPWHTGLFNIIRRDISDILGTRSGNDANIRRDIEQQAITRLLRAKIS